MASSLPSRADGVWRTVSPGVYYCLMRVHTLGLFKSPTGTDIKEGYILGIFSDEGPFELLHFVTGDFNIMKVGH